MSLVVLKKLLDSFLPCIAMAHIFKYLFGYCLDWDIGALPTSPRRRLANVNTLQLTVFLILGLIPAMPCNGLIFKLLYCTIYESHLWDSFLYGAEDADFAGLAVTLRCPDIL